MSDQGKFINTYIDVMVGTIHELMNSSLQMKTQLKMSADMLAEKDKQIGDIVGEKDKVIADLLAEKQSIISVYESRLANNDSEKSDTNAKLQSNKQELDNLRSQLTKIQQDVEPLRSKASHADSLLQQIVVMKQEIKSRDEIISQKNKEIEELTTKPKKTKTATKLLDVLEAAHINNVKDTLSKNKDDF